MRDAHASGRAYRIGIDVGGTFTKAVLIDNATRKVIERYAVKTTHDDPRGVAAGVVAVFRNVLSRSGVNAEEIVFIAHSTTQATNALLEGDVAKVGVLGMAGGTAAALARDQVRIDPIELAPGRMLETANRFLNLDELADEAISDDAMTSAVAELAAEGANVIVASSAFGVDNTATEEVARTAADNAGLLTTCGHEITRLYGLTKRTRTAVINASILPRMNATAEMTEASVREAGITAPLMIMRGDGGVMDIREMRHRPATTMLSGPAASVAGALMHLRVTDGLYFEVGGTSTNIGVIRNGRPTVTYARVGGHETYVSSLDVRVVGIAGGSLARARPGESKAGELKDGELIDIGPRSAHIAGLPYAAFAEPDEIINPAVELFEPKPGDGSDYVAIEVEGGARYALTTTCAANALGYTAPGMHAHGNPDAARRAFAPLAKYLGQTVEKTAEAVLERASTKVIPVVEELIREYRLDRDQCLLIGEGGGAAALVPFTAARTKHPFEISKDAEVISSIGAALALVRDVVERIIPHPKPEDLQAIREEALEAVVRLGAHRKAVEVTVEVDRQTHRVTATAMGVAEMHVKDESGAIHEREARKIAAATMELAVDEIALAASAGSFRVYVDRSAGPVHRVRVVDGAGVIRLRRSQAVVQQATAGEIATSMAAVAGPDGGDAAANAQGIFLLVGDRLIDLSGLEDIEQAASLAKSEVSGLPAEAPVALLVITAR